MFRLYSNNYVYSQVLNKIKTALEFCDEWDIYHIAGMFGEFGRSSVIHQTKTIQIIDSLLADLLICQTFFRQML